MWTYEAPTAAQQSDKTKTQERYERAVHRGLRTIKCEEKLTLRQLQAKLQKAWQRTAQERAEAPTCPGSSMDVVKKDEQSWVMESREISKGRWTDLHIPLASYWRVVLAEEACGQFSRWVEP